MASEPARVVTALALVAALARCKDVPAEAALGQGAPRREAAISDARSSITADATSAPAPVAPIAQPPRAAPDLELIGPITTPPGPSEAESKRVMREYIVWQRACVQDLDDGATVSVLLRFSRGSVQGTPEITIEPDNSAVRDCLRTATSALHITATLPDTEVSARYRVVRRARGPIDPARLCESDSECRFVQGTCSAPAPAHFLHATQVDRNYREMATRRRCANTAATPAELRCVEHQCVGAASPHPEWRGCAQRSECAVIIDSTGRFSALNRSKLREVLANTPGARAARPTDAPPTVECAYQFCALGWAGER